VVKIQTRSQVAKKDFGERGGDEAVEGMRRDRKVARCTGITVSLNVMTSDRRLTACSEATSKATNAALPVPHKFVLPPLLKSTGQGVIVGAWGK
jgi:hypothetical protein